MIVTAVRSPCLRTLLLRYELDVWRQWRLKHRGGRSRFRTLRRRRDVFHRRRDHFRRLRRSRRFPPATQGTVHLDQALDDLAVGLGLAILYWARRTSGRRQPWGPTPRTSCDSFSSKPLSSAWWADSSASWRGTRAPGSPEPCTHAVPSAAVVAVSVSIAVGIIFGFYPAWNASRLSPIDALRHE